MEIIKDICFDLGGNAFLLPYLKRALGAEPKPGEEPERDALPPLQPTSAVKITTDADEGARSEEFDDFCAANSLAVAVIRCPNIVGTNMNGLPRRIAAGIYKGRFVHILGNEARISVVHAVDVAAAALVAAGTQGTYTLTDGTDPTIHDLAEALAARMRDKRIITVKPFWARLWYGSAYYDTLTTSHTAGCTFCEVFPDFHPVAVTEYLRTHVYDEKSL